MAAKNQLMIFWLCCVYLNYMHPYNSLYFCIDFILWSCYVWHQACFYGRSCTLVMTVVNNVCYALPYVKPPYSIGGCAIWDFMKDVGPFAWSSSPPQGSLTPRSEHRSMFKGLLLCCESSPSTNQFLMQLVDINRKFRYPKLAPNLAWLSMG